MYLKADFYVGGWEHSTDEDEKKQFKSILRNVGLTPAAISKDSPSLTVMVNVMYWRKANAIHDWFVKTIQNGKDECQLAYVGRSHLEDLLTLCEGELAAKKNGHVGELEPTSGFFFGSTDRDDWFYEDMKRTVKDLKKLLKDKRYEKADFFYQSSW
jgi:hypothetical protein